MGTTLSFLLQMSSTEATLAVVTGASSGIGRATAIALAKRGRPVLLLARRAERLAEVQSEIGAEGCMTASVDVTDADAVTAAVDGGARVWNHCQRVFCGWDQGVPRPRCVLRNQVWRPRDLRDAPRGGLWKERPRLRHLSGCRRDRAPLAHHGRLDQGRVRAVEGKHRRCHRR